MRPHGRGECDARYADDPPRQCWLINPWFVDENGLTLLRGIQIPIEADAHMFILDRTLRAYHKRRLRPCLTFFFVDGAKVVADAKVIELVALAEDLGV